MDWIFENLFLIFIIISGIIAVLGDGKKKNQEEQNKKTPPQKQSNSAPRTTQRQPRAERKVYTEQERPTMSAGNIQEQQQEQMKRIANKYSAQVQNVEDLEEKDTSTVLPATKDDNQGISQQEMKRRVTSNLSAEGLVNGIIMSEVLGSPRAKKPYRSVVRDRSH
ncbi:hypothetical protein [Oceanobacillus sp. 1P07AA]|uniref:hypothetical protein n=1 Tax=Oceanobacillus sp. 1P07AA TaxID=3132293 RepID=UPI0039A4CDF5